MTLFGQVLLKAASPPPTSNYFNNIDFLTLGYDVLQAFPLTQSGLDPGFKTTRIFNLDSTLHTTADKRFIIPEGTSVVKQLSCQLSFASQQISSESELQDQLKMGGSISGEGWGAAFRASFEYQKLSKEFKSSNDLHVISSGECQVYKAWLNHHQPPNLTASFIADVKQMLLPYALTNGSPEFESEMNFIKIYGTHFIHTLTMGAKFSMIKNVQAQKRQTYGSTSESLEAAASYSGIVSASAEFTYAHQSEAAEAFERQVSSTKTSTIGSRPPVDGDANTWAQQTIDDPMPLYYNLTNITDLLDPRYLHESDIIDKLPQDMHESDLVRYYSGLQANMKEALTLYCKTVENCSPPDSRDYSSQFKLITSRQPTWGYDRENYGEAFTPGLFHSTTKEVQFRYRKADKTLQAIRVLLSDPEEDEEPPWLGTYIDGQIEESFKIPTYHRVQKVKLWSGPVNKDYAIVGLYFIFEDGQISRVFGRTGDTLYSTYHMTGVLSGFHGHFNNNYIFSLGSISFDFLTPDEPTKKVMFATPLFGKAWPCGSPFLKYELDHTFEIYLGSSDFVESVGIKYNEQLFLWDIGLKSIHNKVGPIQTSDTYSMVILSDGPDNDYIEKIIFNGVGSKFAGTHEGMSREEFSLEPWNMEWSEADKYLSLDGVYGRADGGGICSIGFIYTRTYTIEDSDSSQRLFSKILE